MISYDRLHELLNYNEKTEVFNWKVTRSGNAKAGSEAGCLQPSGYIRIGIDRKDYQAHRLAWLYVYGYFPENGIDHKDQIKHHNMIDNLREANKSCNMKNSKPIRADNTSGIKGVGWSKASKNGGHGLRSIVNIFTSAISCPSLTLRLPDTMRR